MNRLLCLTVLILLGAAASMAQTSPIFITSFPPTGLRGNPYSFTFQASGGTGNYTWQITGQPTSNSSAPPPAQLPAGLTLNGATISGTPTQAGSFPIWVSVSDGVTSSGDPAQITIRIVDVSAPRGLVNQPYSGQLSVSGGVGPFRWALSENQPLPPALANFSLSSSGLLTGTPTAAGTFDLFVTINDIGAEETITGSVPIHIDAPLALTTNSPLPPGFVGIPYSIQMGASGGIPPYTWAVIGGSLPPGLTLDPVTGLITGTPSVANTYMFTIRLQDSSLLTPADVLEDSSSGGAWRDHSAAAGTFSSLSLVSGREPHARSSRNADRTAFAPVVPTISRTFTLVINPPPVITTASLPVAVAGTPYTQTLTLAGGVAPATWTLTGGALPPGLSLSPGGVISGTPGTPGVFAFTVAASDSPSPLRIATKQLSIQVNPALVILTQSTLGPVDANAQYVLAFAATGGIPSYSWSLVSGQLPGGVQLSPGGVLSGLPAQGVYQFALAVRDAANNVSTKGFTLEVRTARTRPELAVSSLPAGKVGVLYAVVLQGRGGSQPYTFSVSGTPPGITAQADGGLLGTPTRAGTYPLSVTLTDSNGETASGTVSLLIQPNPIVVTGDLAAGQTGSPYSASFAATGGVPGYTFSASGLPAGLSISSTGNVSGTPTEAGSFQVVITATDTVGQTGNKAATLLVRSGPLTVTTTSLGAAVLNVPYSTSVSAAGGTAPYSWSASGSLPPGLSLSPAGSISGTPSEPGTFSFTVQVTDAAKTTASRSLSITITARVSIVTETLPAGRAGAPYSANLSAAGGAAPYTFSVTSGGLPAGLSLSSSGVITGTPSAAGRFTFSVRASDSSVPQQSSGARAFTIEVGLPAISGLNLTVPDNPNPGQQPKVGLTIAAPFPLDVQGTVTLTFAPDAVNNADDPAIQFATGGRTITFTIPAGSTAATFSGGDAALQTGTVAGTITLTTTLQAAGNSVNCNCDLTRVIRIARAVPSITGARLVRTASGFNVIITGFSTTRELTQAVFRFSGNNLQTTDVTVPLTSLFNGFFQGSQFGGAFSLTIPFTIQGDANGITSVSVTLTNSLGNSQAATVNF